MPSPSLLAPGQIAYDIDLLRQMRGRRLASELRVLCVIGAHRFDELPLVDRVFPKLRRIYLFEPLAEPLAALHALAAADPRLRVFPFAVSDRDGTASFHVTSNAGESSSLLDFGSHAELFPEVKVERTIDVRTRRLESVLDEHGLEYPDALMIDVQGAEFDILKSFGPRLLERVRFIYTEVSTEPVYRSSGLLPEVEALLAPRFVKLGFSALRPGVSMHGNAVFVAEPDVAAAIAFTWHGSLRRSLRRLERRLRGRPPE